MNSPYKWIVERTSMMDFGPWSKEDKTVTIYNMELESVQVPGSFVNDFNSTIKKYTVRLDLLKNCFL